MMRHAGTKYTLRMSRINVQCHMVNEPISNPFEIVIAIEHDTAVRPRKTHTILRHAVTFPCRIYRTTGRGREPTGGSADLIADRFPLACKLLDDVLQFLLSRHEASHVSDAEFTSKKKQTRLDRLLPKIGAVTPWPALFAALLAYYPKGEGRGWPPVGLERMLRMYIAQHCFRLFDEGIENAIYSSQAIRGLVSSLTHESALDATTLLRLRRLLEKHNLARRIIDEINGHLASKGLMLREGTVIDATLIATPPSTKNRDEKRDPEMY